MNRLMSVSMKSALLAMVALMAGCSESVVKGRPKTVPAEGSVMYKGQPIPGATIVCSPLDGKHAAAGVTDSSGRFKLSAFPPKAGAVAGKYKVTISAVEMVAAPPLPEGVHAEDLKLPPPKNLVPAKYSDEATSTLEAVVPEEGRTDLDFELTD